MSESLYTTSTAAAMTGIPLTTIVSLERRGVVGPFQRDSSGRRLLREDDIEQLRAYAEDRRKRKEAA
jgi:DNA-binding transcriptional MerR regulator